MEYQIGNLYKKYFILLQHSDEKEIGCKLLKCFDIKNSCVEYFDGNFNEINWNHISSYPKLSKDFIEKHKDRVDWNRISYHQKLSEDFIEKHKDRVNWNNISYYQKLSESFRQKMKKMGYLK